MTGVVLTGIKSRRTATVLTFAIGLTALIHPAAAADDATPFMIKDINPSGSSNPTELTTAAGTLYFSAVGPGGRELWKSDGDEGGTTRVKNIRPGARGSDPTGLTSVEGLLFFTADDGVHGRELWKSDGTTEGTRLVRDIRSSDGARPRWLTRVGSTLFFTADDGRNGRELWRTDGTRNGTAMVKNIVPGPDGSDPSQLARVGALLFFTIPEGPFGEDGDLWKSDGTGAGTVKVKNFPPMLGAHSIVAVGPVAYFAAFGNPGYTGFSYLWKSDGTRVGTRPVVPGGDSPFNVDQLTNGGGILYFEGYLEDGGEGIWKTDGTPGGTLFIKDPSGPSAQIHADHLTNAAGRLFFEVWHGDWPDLWTSDGSPEGTILLKSSLISLYPRATVGGSLFFGFEGDLWSSDGSVAGTDEVGSVPGGSELHEITAIGETIWFSANDGIHGRELWVSDQLAAGTVLAADIGP